MRQSSVHLEVWGDWELGCWRMSRKRLFTSRIGGSKYRWPWNRVDHTNFVKIRILIQANLYHHTSVQQPRNNVDVMMSWQSPCLGDKTRRHFSQHHLCRLQKSLPTRVPPPVKLWWVCDGSQVHVLHVSAAVFCSCETWSYVVRHNVTRRCKSFQILLLVRQRAQELNIAETFSKDHPTWQYPSFRIVVEHEVLYTWPHGNIGSCHEPILRRSFATQLP